MKYVNGVIFTTDVIEWQFGENDLIDVKDGVTARFNCSGGQTRRAALQWLQGILEKNRVSWLRPSSPASGEWEWNLTATRTAFDTLKDVDWLVGATRVTPEVEFEDKAAGRTANRSGHINFVITKSELEMKRGKRDPSEFVLFYSWQDDLPKKTNRYFVEDCLDRALKIVQQDMGLSVRLDQDTQDTSGTPNVTEVIWEKIAKCEAFVADITPVARTPDGKGIANPNVMMELEHARASVGWDRILYVFNEAFGDGLKDRPFHLSGPRRQPLTFSLKEGDSLSDPRSAFVSKLVEALKAIARQSHSKPPPVVRSDPGNALSVDAQHVLFRATNPVAGSSWKGMIMTFNAMVGRSFSIGGEVNIFLSDQADVARMDAALDELLKADLIKGSGRDQYQVTHRGFQQAESVQLRDDELWWASKPRRQVGKGKS